jgi:Xaa-Pro aminopeptidase
MYPARPDIGRIKNLMTEAGLDLLIAISPENVFYLSDSPVHYTNRNALLYSVRNSSPVFCLLPLDGEPKIVLTASALEVVEKFSWIKDKRIYKTGTYIVRQTKTPYTTFENYRAALENTIKELKAKNVGVDYNRATYKLSMDLSKILADLNMKTVDATEVFLKARMIKNDEELRRFREANRIIDRALLKAIAEIKVGMYESEIQDVFKYEMLKGGADGWFQTTVAAGPENGPDIFNQPDGRIFKKNDIIRFDVSCVYRGFGCDISRTICLGDTPTEAKKLYNVLERAESLLLENAKPGVKACDLHSIAVNYVRKEFDPNYTRGNVGHGVGVELYDPPEISASDETKLQVGMTLSLEVPYHKFGLGGFNIEDSVIVKDDGVEVLTSLPRELLEV